MGGKWKNKKHGQKLDHVELRINTKFWKMHLAQKKRKGSHKAVSGPMDSVCRLLLGRGHSGHFHHIIVS